MRSVSIYGTGLRLYGLEAEPPDQVIATQWLTFCFIPVVPLQRFKGRYLGEGPANPHSESGRLFDAVERLPLSLPAIFATYVLAIVGFVAGVGPIVCLLCRIQNRGATPLEIALGLVFMIWPVALVSLLEYRQEKFLESTWGREALEAVEANRSAQAAQNLASWRQKHCFPEWSYICAMVIGLLPGVAVAEWFAWGGNARNFAALATAVLGLALIAAVDWLMMRLWFRPAAR